MICHAGHLRVALVDHRLWRDRGLQPGAPDHVDQIEPGEDEAGDQRAGVELDDRDAGRRRIDDQHDRRRDQDAERAAGADDAGGEAGVVAGLEHRREGEEPHQRHHRADDAGGGRKQRAGDQRRHRHRAGNPPRDDAQRREQPVDDVGALDDVAHEQEQRHGGQDVVGHDREGLVHEQVEDVVVEEAADPQLGLLPPVGAVFDRLDSRAATSGSGRNRRNSRSRRPSPSA